MLAKIAVDQNDLDLAMKHIGDALSVDPHPDTLIFFVTMLNNFELHDMASEILALAGKTAPRNPRRAKIWKEEVERLHRAQLETRHAPQP